MSSYKGHVIGGVFAYLVGIAFVVVTQLAPVDYVVEWFLCCILGALAPDIDTKSKGQKIFYQLLTIVTILLILHKQFYILACMSLISFVPMLVSHRTLLHNFWFIALLVGISVAAVLHFLSDISPVAVISNAIFFLLGVISHLWLDFGIRRAFALR